MKRIASHRLLLLCAIATVACEPAEIRSIVYPPSFVYIERRELNTVMWRFASSVAELDHALNPDPGDSIDLGKAAAALRELDATAARLPIEESTNHPMLGERANRLRKDIRLALDLIEAPVPDVGVARSVTGACLYCHATSER